MDDKVGPAHSGSFDLSHILLYFYFLVRGAEENLQWI